MIPPSFECDVLIAGSGASGLTAAITAHDAGLKVLIAEKEPVFGGTTAYSAGVVWIPCNDQAVAAGIADSADQALRYLSSEVGDKLDVPKARAFVTRAGEMLRAIEATTHVRFQLQSTWADYHPKLPGGVDGGRSLLPEAFDGRKLGVQFSQLRAPIETMMIFGGMSLARDDLPHVFNMTRSLESFVHMGYLFARYCRDRLTYPRGTRITNGNALVARLALSAQERGIELMLNSPVVRLLHESGLSDQSGQSGLSGLSGENSRRVTGAIIKRDGQEIEVRTRRGVILACGGFPGNTALQAKHYAHVGAGKFHQSAAPASNTGDGIALAQAVGAAVNSNVHYPAAWTPMSLVPRAGGRWVPFPHFVDRGKPGYISVDRRGRRFANESQSYHDFTPRMIAACANDAQVEAWIVCDHASIRKFGLGVAPPAPGRLGPHLRNRYLTRAATIRELAEKLGIDADGLSETVDTFNRGAVDGKDPQFDRGSDAYQRFNGSPNQQPNPCVAPVQHGPFYAVRIVPGDIGTFLGLRTDPVARVLNDTSQVIAGLYAVGNDQTSVMGGTYPGAGITLGPAMTFGYLAARHAAGLERVTADELNLSSVNVLA
jgi:succinate dehydrogenase/fumarate reductase flavoprotein subunit